MLKYLLLGCTLASLGHAQSRDTVLNNVEGYKMERAPTYLVVTPRKVRPNQVIQVFTTMLKMEYPTVNMRVSIVKDGVEYGSNVVKFERPGSRMLQIQHKTLFWNTIPHKQCLDQNYQRGYFSKHGVEYGCFGALRPSRESFTSINEVSSGLVKETRTPKENHLTSMRSNAQQGNYFVRVEGQVETGTSGNIFENETAIEFSSKQASLFIQLSKPIYRQGQNVFFRVIPILPNLMPKYGSMTVYVLDPTGFPVRRWLAVQTNAGGIVSQNFTLADQPNYGNWTIQVAAFGFIYNKTFLVEEFWDPRFDVNVTVKPYILDSVKTVGGVLAANITTGKPVEGNATVMLTVVPAPDPRYYNNPAYPDYNPRARTVQMQRHYNYIKGPVSFEFSMDEISRRVRDEIGFYNSLENFEMIFNVSVRDWFLDMQETGFASTIIVSSKYKLQWVGDKVRTFKPDSVLTVQVAAMTYDGRPVTDSQTKINMQVFPSYGTTGSGTPIYIQPKTPVNGIAQFQIPIDVHLKSLKLAATLNGDSRTRIEMMTYRFYSPSNNYIILTTSTPNPKINEYMIFHVKLSNFVPRIYYQVVAGGNIIVGEELEMISRRKTFAIALSKEMVPTARVVVYYISTSPEEIVIDALSFSVSGTKSNQVTAKVNLGKDFTRDTVEIITTADPGSYMAFAAMPDDLYRRGINDGLTEYNLIDELNTYDQPARGSWQHLWRKSETEFEYKFFTATGHGIDTNTTFRDAGLVAISDVTVNRVPTEPSCNMQGAEFQPCFDGSTCYHINKTCDGNFDCPNDWADEQNCPVEDPRYDNRTMGSYMINRVSRVLRFYEDSAWAWKEIFTKPDGEVDFRVKVPKYPLTWVINGISMSRNLGLGLMAAPLKYDGTRYMYIIVESPEYIIRGEQLGVRVTVFNYWAKDDFIEVLVTMEGSTEYDSVLVGEEGFVTSYNPITHSGDHQTLVFLEPGESKDIFMPIVPKAVRGKFNFTVSAWCFLERDTVTRTVYIDSDGVENYFHTPYLLDMITYGSIIIPDLKINVSDQFIVPEQRFHSYVPGSPKATVSMFGDVVTPGFFREYLTVEDLMHKPYGAAEMNMFNFAYNLLTLKFKKANQQLSNDVLKKALSYMNIGLQRQLSYMNKDGSFRMFRDDDKSSLWLTAFVAKTLYDARFGEWEKDMFIPLELINTMVLWICDQQNSTTGEFNENITTPLYDRTYGSLKEMKNKVLMSHPVPLTAYVLIALYKISDVSGQAQSCIEKSRNRAASYLYNQRAEIIRNNETFHLAITAYALSLSAQESQSMFNALWLLKRESTGLYFSDSEIQENPSDFINTVRYLLPRLELINDGYATQSTAYALMAHIKHYGSQTGGRKSERDSMMGWLQTMRNFVGAMASTQDTLVAMEALFDFTQVDPNRNVFNLYTLLECSSQPDWSDVMFSTKENYTDMQFAEIDKVYGQVRVTAQGTGRALIQLTTTMNVEYEWQIKNPVGSQKFYDLVVDNSRFVGRNFSQMHMTVCVSWVYTVRSRTSGLSVLEIDVPSGYVVLNDTLRSYVQSGVVRNLKRAEFYYRKVVFYFDYLDQSKTCVYFQANRWYPVANMTIQHRIRVYDYYEPGMHNTGLYTTYNLFNLNVCYVCGSYQCPYCPFFNVATVIKASFTLVTLLIGFLLKKYLLRIT